MKFLIFLSEGMVSKKSAPVLWRDSCSKKWFAYWRKAQFDIPTELKYKDSKANTHINPILCNKRYPAEVAVWACVAFCCAAVSLENTNVIVSINLVLLKLTQKNNCTNSNTPGTTGGAKALLSKHLLHLMQSSFMPHLTHATWGWVCVFKWLPTPGSS